MSTLVNGALCCYLSFIPAEGNLSFLNAEEELLKELMQNASFSQ